MTEIPRVLIIDDEEAVRKTISKVLEHSGYVVDTAENGKEAVEKTEANFYNLALIDIRLPDMEGTKLLTAMRETTPKMVKIILTGYPALQNAIEAVNKGADGYLTKPVNMDDLLRTIKEHLEKQSKAEAYGEEKIKEFVETRLKEMETKQTNTQA